MSYALMIERLRARAGLESTDRAEHVMEAVLTALGQAISGEDKKLLFRHMPQKIFEILSRPRHRGAVPIDRLHASIARREGTSRGIASEHAQLVGELLREEMDEEAIKLLPLHLRPELASLFGERAGEPASTGDEARHFQPGSGRTLATGRPTTRHSICESEPERTLATGRPGSLHPVSEAAAPEPRTAQSESVAASSNPHGGRKLSSTHGP